MKILLTNDDGYQAKGFLQLAYALNKKHEVYLCAPLSERSGSSHALSFVNTVHFQQIDTVKLTAGTAYAFDAPCFAVDGTPADATKFALEHIYRDEKFDLVVSGINTVLNIGTDTIYSGTFNSAEEGTILGVKSIAISTVDVDGDYSFPVGFLLDNLDAIVKRIQPMVTVNINIPSSKRNVNKGLAVVPLGLRRYNDWYEDSGDGLQLTGYTLDCADRTVDDDCKMADLGYITVTPVRVISRDEDLLRSFEEIPWKY